MLEDIMVKIILITGYIMIILGALMVVAGVMIFAMLVVKYWPELISTPFQYLYDIL